jgi:hypothetical protein
MDQKKRIFIALGLLVLIVLLVTGVEFLRRGSVAQPTALEGQATLAVTLAPGSIPVYLNGGVVAGFSPDDLQQLKQVNFVDAEEGKSQDGWLLKDVLLLYIKPDLLQSDTLVTVSSSSRKKSVQIAWSEISAEENLVMFDLSGRGTLKLVAKQGTLSKRDAWVQDVDKIEVGQP